MSKKPAHRDWSRAAIFGVGCVLVAFSLVAAALLIVREGLNANAAAWIQASGSIGTILGAVWLFATEQSLRRQERRTIGEEIAWSVRFALTNAQLEAHTIAAELVADNLLDREDVGRQWYLRTENCANVLKVFAERVDHIHPTLNHIASNGVLLLRQMDGDIARALDAIQNGKRPSMKAAADVAWYESHFEELIQLLDSRMRGVRLALDEAPNFPSEHRKIWTVPEEQRAAALAASASPNSEGS